MTDFSKTLIRSSAAGYLFVEPQSKADKEAGNLSKTAQNYLIKTYVKAKYDREQDIVTKQMTKGIEAEEKSIEILSIHQQKLLKKNEQRLENGYLTGLPDVFEGESIEKATFLWDIKTSWSIWTFLANVPDKLDPLYYYQLQAYMALTGCSKAAIAYCLTDAPQHLIEAEKKKLMYSMNVATELAPEYVEAAAQVEINMIYPDIPISEKVLIFPVDRDDEVIDRLYQKVEKARQFLQEFEQKHVKFNENIVVLPC
jgi:hypothetical protein